MKAVAVLLCTVGVVFAASLPSMGSSDSVGPALLDIAHTVNGKAGVSWKAGHNERWNRYSEKEVRAMLGVKFDDSVVIADRARFSAAQYARTPKELDLRTRTVGNTTCIGPILDQAKCGSCWAFAAAEAISDRFCLKTGSFVQLAPLDLVACDQNDGGCEGGDPGSAWQYATGGLALETCMPYLQSEGGPIPTCPPAQEPCLDFVSTPNCPSTCNGGAAIDRSHQVATVYGLSTVQDMMTELNENGSIEVAFTVYSDFLTYKSGVYTYQTGDALGGHAVKMIGYGTENGVDYWLCQNSWTTTWGDAGFFKIRRGTDECGIEDDAVAGTLA